MPTATPDQLERVAVRLPLAEISEIDRLAAAEKRSRSFLIREAVDEYLTRRHDTQEPSHA